MDILDTNLDCMDDIVDFSIQSLDDSNGNYPSHLDRLNETNSPLLGEEPGRPNWTPPESWAVVTDDEGTEEDGWSSSSDESDDGGTETPQPQDTHIRIYHSNNTYHLAYIATNVEVSKLTSELNGKSLIEDHHRLYLKERGRGMFSD